MASLGMRWHPLADDGVLMPDLSLSLPLFVLRVIAYNADLTLTLDYFALFANWFY